MSRESRVGRTRAIQSALSLARPGFDDIHHNPYAATDRHSAQLSASRWELVNCTNPAARFRERLGLLYFLALYSFLLSTSKPNLSFVDFSATLLDLTLQYNTSTKDVR